MNILKKKTRRLVRLNHKHTSIIKKMFSGKLSPSLKLSGLAVQKFSQCPPTILDLTIT